MSASSTRLGDIIALNPPTPRGLLGSHEEVAIVPMAAVAETGTMAVQEYRAANDVSSGLSYFSDGDVLVAKITPCYENNKIALAKIDRQHAFGSTEFHVLRPKPRHLDARYLVHFLRQDAVREQGKRRMTGSGGQRRVPRSFLEELAIPLPPLEEQRRIVAILDQADTLRSRRLRASELLEDLERALFVKMFGNALTNPKSYPRLTMREIGKVTTGNTPSRVDPDNYGDEIEWVKSDNLNNNDYYVTQATERLSRKGRLKARTVRPGAVLVTCIAGSPDCIGNIGMADREVAFNQQINALQVQQGDPAFVYAQLRLHKGLVQAASTNSMKGMVSKSRFEEIKLIFPPLEEQSRYAQVEREIRSAIDLARRGLVRLDALFASLQYRAFAGEL